MFEGKFSSFVMMVDVEVLAYGRQEAYYSKCRIKVSLGKIVIMKV